MKAMQYIMSLVRTTKDNYVGTLVKCNFLTSRSPSYIWYGSTPLEATYPEWLNSTRRPHALPSYGMAQLPQEATYYTSGL